MRKTTVLFVALALLGCGSRNFNRPDLLTEPRILAVQAEPPQPTVGTSTTLRALVYQPPAPAPTADCPNPGAAAQYKWSWCPLPTSASDNYACHIAQAEFDQISAALGLGPAPSLDLGTNETATFTNPFPAALLYSLCRGDIGLPLAASSPTPNPDGGEQPSTFKCSLPSGENTSTPPAETHPIGFPVTIYVSVTPPCPSSLPAGFNPMTAIFTVHLPTNDAIPGNSNPVMNGIYVTSQLPDGGAPSYDAAPIPQDSGGALDGATADDGGTSQADGAAATTGVTGADASAPSSPVVGWELDEQGSGPRIPRQKHVSIQLDVPIASSEFLAQPGSLDDEFDSNGNLLGTMHFERLNFAWFIEAGDLGSEGNGGRSTGFLPGLPDVPSAPSVRASADQAQFLNALGNTWTLPFLSDYAPGTARMIVVVRDSRGGVSWTSGVASLENQP